MHGKQAGVRAPISAEAGLSMLVSLTIRLSGDPAQRELGKDMWEHYRAHLDALMESEDHRPFALEFVCSLNAHVRAMAVARGVFDLRKSKVLEERALRQSFYQKLAGMSTLNYEGVVARLGTAIAAGLGAFALVTRLSQGSSWQLMLLVIAPFSGAALFTSDVLIRRYASLKSQQVLSETDDQIPPIWREVAEGSYTKILASLFDEVSGLIARFYQEPSATGLSESVKLRAVKRGLLQLNPSVELSPPTELTQEGAHDRLRLEPQAELASEENLPRFPL